MQRIELQLPDKFVFTTEMPVRVDDVNYGGHLGNDRVLTLVHEARIRFLKEHGYSEMDIDGTGLIQVNTAITYEEEGKLGDLLSIRCAPDNVSPMGFDFYAQLSKEQTDDVIASVRTGMVGYDTERHQPVRLPETFVTSMKNLVSNT